MEAINFGGCERKPELVRSFPSNRAKRVFRRNTKFCEIVSGEKVYGSH